MGTWRFYPKGGQHVIKSATWTLIKENILVEKQIHCSFLTDWIYFANHGWNFCTVNNFNSIKSLICPYMIMIHYTFCLKVKEDSSNKMASIIYSKVGSRQFQGRWKIYDSVCLEPQLMFKKEKPQTCQYFFSQQDVKTCLLTHYVTLWLVPILPF